MASGADAYLVRENREYLDEFYRNRDTIDNISNINKCINIYKVFGITGVVKKIFKKAMVKKEYISNINEENYPEVKIKEKKIAVYTAIFGNYDNLLEPKFISPNCDYFIFTDMQVRKDSVWKKKELPIDNRYMNLGTYQKAKYFKVFPHAFFEEYEYSIWVDGNILIYGDLAPFVDRMNSSFLAEFEHPNNDCIYDEAFSIVSQQKANGIKVKYQIECYKKQGFPSHYGLFENSFIIRRHNDLRCINLMNTWWEQMEQYTWRDQLSLSYSMWKCGIKLSDVTILGPCWRWNPRLRQYNHIS